MRSLLALFVLASCSAAWADEGMWTLDNLPKAQLKQKYAFEPDQAWIDKAMKSSVRLASGCSGSFVSPDGLVLTNNHCVIGCVSGLSSKDKDYVNNGFLAKDRAAELQCPDIELNRLEAITDVTARIGQATTNLSGKAYSEAKNAEKAKLESECAGGSSSARCDVVELYNGGLYHLYRYHRFQDVRLVWSPEYATGFFGGDPDNFNFPRYNLDAGLLRAYENGKPAKVDDYFPLTTQGVKPGELTMVTGHPGSTQRLLTVAQLERRRDIDMLHYLINYSERRGLLIQYGRQGAEAERQAQNDLTRIENSLKVFKGQMQALQEPALLQRKRDDEAALRAAADATQSGAWDEIARAQQTYRDIWIPYDYIETRFGFWSKHFEFARHLVRGAEERAKPNGERLREYQDATLPTVTQALFSSAALYPEFEKAKLAWSLSKLREMLGPDDEFVKLVFGKESPDALAARLIGGTKLGDIAVRRSLWEGGAEAVAQSRDPFIQLARAIDAPARAIRRQYENDVEALEKKAAETISKVRFAKSGTNSYPDATFTLRLSYGEVAGWEDKGRQITPFTDFAGLYARATGFDPFRLAPRWLEKKSELTLATPFNFVTSNDIIGGNSGSPVINRKGEIVGLAFDGNIQSLGGAYWFDERVNRCVSVDARALIEALRVVYGAESLVKEINPL